MADNVAITEGSGKSIASDEVSGVNYQVVKLADATAESTTGIYAGTGTSANAMRVTMANDSATMGVYLASTAGTINVALKPGTIAVQFDPGYTLGAVTGSGTFGIYFDSSAGTINVALKPGTLAVQFDPGHEIGMIKGSNSSIAVYFDRANPNVLANAGTGTFTVQFDSSKGFLQGINSTVTVKTDPSSVIQISNAPTITGITNTIGVYLNATAGTLQVKIDPASAGIGRDDVAFVAGTGMGTPVMGFYDDTATDSVDEGDIGVMRMTANRLQMIHTDGTASIFTASGSASGVSASGNTIISPSANASFKIYAFSIQTTAQVSLTCTFTNGAGSATEFWRPLITASGVTGAQGANLSTGGPGNPLFVTGTSTTLALKLDSASLVHYSVSYTKESA